MEHITVNRDELLKLMDDVEDLAQYIETLVNWAYGEGYNQGRFDTEEL